ncbi:MAG TPA: hypothetical protein VMJ35_00560 [Dongiaceae bacterium]|nr:hypothetical protein [Dongiaceae bacterium]
MSSQVELSAALKNFLALGVGALFFFVNRLYLPHPKESVFGVSAGPATGPLARFIVWYSDFLATLGQNPWVIWAGFFIFGFLLVRNWRAPSAWIFAVLTGVYLPQVIFYLIP